MIYTCTLNPSIDYILHLDHFTAGGLNRGEDPHYFPGGKGINVSRLLKTLGISSTALGFTGGFTGSFIKDALESEAIKTDFIEVDGTTRINLKLKAADETEINGPGPVISDRNKQQLLDQIEQLTDHDTLVLAGSLAKALPDDFYKTMVKTANQHDVKIVLDTSSEALKAMIGSPLFLVKPNHHELAELYDTTISSSAEAITYGKKLLNEGITHVLISMGGAGAVYLHDDVAYTAKAPVGDVLNTVGAGDSTVAGFLAGIEQGLSNDECFRLAVASGSATAFSHDLATKKDVEALLHKIDVVEATL